MEACAESPESSGALDFLVCLLSIRSHPSTSSLAAYMPRPPPAKRKLIDLVQEKRKDDHDGDATAAAAEDGGAEADYMSDALLPTASTSSSSSLSNKKRSIHDSPAQRARLDERETRAQGLSRPVGQQLPLALRMMQAMGYEEGQALGAQKDDQDDGNDDDDGKAQGRRDGPLLAPVRPDLTRSSDDKAKRRAGIGAVIASQIADAANASLDPLSTDDFRSRAAAQAADARAGKTLNEAKRVCRDLDMRVGVEYLPLWLQGEWFQVKEDMLGLDERRLVEIALGEEGEEEETEGQEREESQTLQDGDGDGEQNGQGDKDKDDTATRPSPPRPLSRRREARAFLSLPVSTPFYPPRLFSYPSSLAHVSSLLPRNSPLAANYPALPHPLTPPLLPPLLPLLRHDLRLRRGYGCSLSRRRRGCALKAAQLDPHDDDAAGQSYFPTL